MNIGLSLLTKSNPAVLSCLNYPPKHSVYGYLLNCPVVIEPPSTWVLT